MEISSIKDNKCSYMSHSFNVNVIFTTGFDCIIGHHQAHMNLIPVIKINGKPTVLYSCKWWRCCQLIYTFI
jgi:hypothetical protein